MELGMFTSGYQYYPLERAFADARRFGYDYIELWGGRPHAFVQHELVAHEEDGGRALQCGIRSRALPRICRLTLPSVIIRPAPPRIRRAPAGMLLHHAPHAPRFGRTTRL